MSNILYVLYSSFEANSRDFIKQIPADSGAILIDWADQSQHANYFGPGPSQFPVVCMTVMVNGVASDTLVGMFTPSDWSSVVKVAVGIDQGSGADNQSYLSSIGLWQAYSAGQALQGPLVDLFAETVLLKSASLSPDAKVNVPLLILLFRSYASTQPALIQQYWNLLKTNKPPAWLDPQTIGFIESVCALYNIPLLPAQVQKS